MIFNGLSESGMIATCDTMGFLTLQNVLEYHNKNVIQWQAHEFEVWAVAFDKHDSNRIFSGKDQEAQTYFLESEVYKNSFCVSS